MIVQPSFDAYITYQDKDLQRALHFLISLSTVLEEMTQDMERSATLQDEIIVSYEKYAAKIERHAGAYEIVYQAFTDEVFGNY